MGKGWRTGHKGRSKNKKQRDAADVATAAAELAGLASKRKRSSDDAGSSSPKRHKHVPQKLGRGGAREKLDVDRAVALADGPCVCAMVCDKTSRVTRESASRSAPCTHVVYGAVEHVLFGAMFKCVVCASRSS